MDVQAMCDEPGEATMSEKDDADDLGQDFFLYPSKHYLLHRLFDDDAKEPQSAVAFSSVKEEAYGMLKQISRMKTEYESDSTCKVWRAVGYVLIISPMKTG